MMINVGLIGESSPWSQLLSQEGVPYGTVDMENFAPAEWSLVVVNRTIAHREREVIERYLGSGGAVLGFTGHLVRVCGIDGVIDRVEFLVSDGDDLFSDVHLLDLGVEGAIAREANALRTNRNVRALFAGPLGGGYAVVFPFDPAELTFDWRAASKCFYFGRDRLPYERVSLVSKGEVRHLLHRALEYLHHVRGLPYARLWPFPAGKRNLFAFRIDTDGAPKMDIERLHELASQYHISLSWYLDVKSHEQWLSHFGRFEKDEIGVHCYEHKVYPSYEGNLENILSAVRAMNLSGLKPKGFSAPFGEWNPSLARATDDLGFEYSSEFSYAYDTLPFYPEVEGIRSKALQIPIHPVCIGSMVRVGFVEKQMREYYRQNIELKLSRGEPLFYYHHPSHGCWSVVEEMFANVRRMGIDFTTMLDFASWWKCRETIKLRIKVANDAMTFETGLVKAERSDVWVEVSLPNGKTALRPLLEERTELRDAGFGESSHRVPAPPDIRRIREFDPRAAIGQWYNALMRKLQ